MKTAIPVLVWFVCPRALQLCEAILDLQTVVAGLQWAWLFFKEAADVQTVLGCTAA